MESDPQQWPIVKAYPIMWFMWCCVQRSHIMTTHHILMPNHCCHPSYKFFCHQNPISCWYHPYHSPGCSNPSETDLLPLGKDKGDQGIFVQCLKFKGGQRGNCAWSCKLTRYSVWCCEGNHNPSLVSRYVLYMFSSILNSRFQLWCSAPLPVCIERQARRLIKSPLMTFHISIHSLSWSIGNKPLTLGKT